MGFIQAVREFGPFFSALAALGSLTAAGAAWRSSFISRENTRLAEANQRQQREVQKYQRTSAILDQRYSNDMHHAKRAIRKLIDDFRERQTTRLVDSPSTVYISAYYDYLRKKPGDEGDFEKLDSHRAFFTKYFIKLFDLHKAGMLEDEEMRGFVNGSDLALLSEMKPVEFSINDSLISFEPREGKERGSDPLFDYFDDLRKRGLID